MDILGMLQGDLDEMCLEDMEMLSEELNIGNYPPNYVRQCMLFINRYKRSFEAKKSKVGYVGGDNIAASAIVRTDEQVRDVGEVQEPSTETLSKLDIFRNGLEDARHKPDTNNAFWSFLQLQGFASEESVDEYFSEFNTDERDILLTNMQFSEGFLDKYFDFLDHGKLAIYQLYSEEFYMKHFSEMKAQLVLTRSKNEWRRKSNRSKKLEVFLRLKGVKI